MLIWGLIIGLCLFLGSFALPHVVFTIWPEDATRPPWLDRHGPVASALMMGVGAWAVVISAALLLVAA